MNSSCKTMIFGWHIYCEIYNEIEDFFKNLKHVVVSRVITLRNKKLEKYEICDELYNSLLSVTKV